MKYIKELHRLKIFHKKEVAEVLKDENVTKEILRRYKKQGLITQVRRDLYVAADLATKASLANKFEIAGHITPSSCLAYHSALEYHGLAHQVFYTLYVSSKEMFRDFDFEGIRYVFCLSKPEIGVIRQVTDSFVRVTDLERTVLDCINRIDLSGGLEELVQSFALITSINERRLSDYLAYLNKKYLYQKTGFILRYFQKEMRLSDDFFELCKSRAGKSVRYLTDTGESDSYHKEWRLCAPPNILSFLEQGGVEHV